MPAISSCSLRDRAFLVSNLPTLFATVITEIITFDFTSKVEENNYLTVSHEATSDEIREELRLHLDALSLDS